MSKRVVLIDGPRQGDVVTLPDGQPDFLVADPGELSIVEPLRESPPPLSQTMKTAAYHFTHVYMFGETFLMGSCREGGPDMKDVFATLASNAAKEVVQ